MIYQLVLPGTELPKLYTEAIDANTYVIPPNGVDVGTVVALVVAKDVVVVAASVADPAIAVILNRLSVMLLSCTGIFSSMVTLHFV